MNRRGGRLALVVVAMVAAASVFVAGSRLLADGAVLRDLLQRRLSAKTVADRVAQYGDVVDARLRPAFSQAGVPYPPRDLALLGLKLEKRLEVWARDGKGVPRLLRSYPVLAASGGLGPKLREGDQQVPEGLYRIELLNPNSLFHLSLRVSYPNAFDRARGREDGRARLGGDIMIHGNRVSIGCLAMGDEAAEDLFVLAARTGLPKISVILSPVDFRVRELPDERPKVPGWTAALYAEIRRALSAYGGAPAAVSLK